MATLLYRIGRFSFRRRWLVVGLWVLLLALVGLGAATLSGQTSNSFTTPGTESQIAIDQLAERFPQANAKGAEARVVFAAPAGQTLSDPANKTTVSTVVAALHAAPKVTGVGDPYKSISKNGRYAIANVNYAVAGPELSSSDKDALLAAADAGRAAGLTVEFGGDALQGPVDTGFVEVIGIAVAALVLLITLGSLIAAGLPLLTAVVGVAVGLGGLAIVSGFVDLNANSLILALMLGIAVGIDYALFIVSRYRHERLIGRDGDEAAGRAVGTAGTAVVFAGLTVIIALAGLTVVGVPILGAMGLAAAGTVAVAVLVALTLLPALLGVAGRRISPHKRLRASRMGNTPGDAGALPVPMGEKWARFVIRFRVPVLVVTLAAVGVVAVPAAGLRLGLPDDGTAAASSTQRKAYDLIATGFGPGVNGPLVVVADIAGVTDAKDALSRASATIAKIDGVVTVNAPMTSPDGRTAILTVIPATGPNDARTTDLVHAIRNHRAAIRTDTGVGIAVTGQTALNIDVSDTLSAALLPYLALIVGLAFLLLMLVFRSLLVPLKATVGFLLSVAATFGAVVAVFQWGWLGGVFGVGEPGPIMSLLPILLVGILFGLAMDYQVFLAIRMREDYVHGATARAAVVTGFRHSARVVTAAAIIMISVFGGFIFSHQSFIKPIGFALAFGVLVDAFIVRMTIVPAVMSLLGRSAWWLPRWLARILPNVDVEGEKLTRMLAAEAAVADLAAAEDPQPVTVGSH